MWLLDSLTVSQQQDKDKYVDLVMTGLTPSAVTDDWARNVCPAC